MNMDAIIGGVINVTSSMGEYPDISRLIYKRKLKS